MSETETDTPSPAGTAASPGTGPTRDAPKIAYLLATWFGCGRSPKAPGTVGSLGALPFAYAILAWGGGWPVLAAAAVAATLVGLWATAAMLRATGTKDPSWVVIDEVAGQWLALLPAGTDPVLFAAGFVLFRLFDIWKPWPVGWADRDLPGAWGVMVDDLLAGLYAAALVWAFKVWGLNALLHTGT